jgi:hypothetical protein
MNIELESIRMFLWRHARSPTAYGGMPGNASGVALALLAIVIAEEDNCGLIQATNKAWDLIQETVTDIEYWPEEPKYLCDEKRLPDRTMVRSNDATRRNFLALLRRRYPDQEPTKQELEDWYDANS